MHWTYGVAGDRPDLEQGDILQPAPELLDELAAQYPQLGDSRVRGLLVATQSCDLVRRGGRPCDAGTISVAPIKPLVDVLPEFLGRMEAPLAERVFAYELRKDARLFLGRLVNQNEQKEGLFFLYEDNGVGISERSVGLLRESVAISPEWYERLVRMRTGTLAPAFRAKLGWLLGNLFARPATPDWGDTEHGKRRSKDIVEEALAEAREGQLKWIERQVAQAALANELSLATVTDADLQKLRPKPIRERLADVLIGYLVEVMPDLDDGLRRTLRNRVVGSAQIKALLAENRGGTDH